jgi:hypothetical protein
MLNTTGVTIKSLEGVSWSGSVGTFTDSDGNTNPAFYTAAITWGDGSPTTSGTITGNGTFTVTGGHQYADEGTYNISVSLVDIFDHAGGTISSTAKVTDAPLTAVQKALQLTEGAAATNQTVASFKDANVTAPVSDFTATIYWGNNTSTGGAVVSTGGGNFNVTATPPTYTEAGSYNLRVVVTDDGGSTVTINSAAFVKDAALTATGTSLSTTACHPLTATFATFTDADPNGTLSDYTATIDWGDGNSISQVTVGTGSGNFTISGTHNYATAGTYTAKVTAIDVDGARSTANTTVTVGSNKLMPTNQTLSYVEGAAAAQQTLATFTDSDGNTSTSAYSATINWGDGTAATNATIATNPGGGFQINASHSYSEEGKFTITISLTDTDGDSCTSTSTANVSDAALTATAVSTTATACKPFEGTVATFTDADPNGAIGDYTATINWGDNSQQTGGIIQVNSPSGFKVLDSHKYKTPGTYSVTVTINDQGGSSATATSTITVGVSTLAVSNITATEGVSFSGNVAVFTPSPFLPASSYTAKIGWGDGVVSTATLTANGNTYNVSGSHTYKEEGSETITLTILDSSNNEVSCTATATVNDAALTPTAQNQSLWKNCASGQQDFGKFSDANTGAPASDFTATIVWGDGTPNGTGTVQALGGGSFGVFANHTYTTTGSFTCTITVTDDGGQTTTITSTETVATPSIMITATEGVQFSGVVASFTGPPSQATSANIVWGDGSNSAGTIVSTGQNSYNVTGTHTYADETTYNNITVTVQRTVGGPITDSGCATVNDAALTATGVSTVITCAGKSTGTITLATFTDANPTATLADFTANVSWGDGTSSAGTVQANGSGWKVVGSHTYDDSAASYNAVVTITDDGGSQATAPDTFTVGWPEGETFDLQIDVTPPSGSTETQNYAASIDWGDGTTSTASVEVNPASSGNGSVSTLTVTGSHAYADEGTGTYTVTATVTDVSTNATASGTKTVNICEVPIDSTGNNFSTVVGCAMTVTTAFVTDDNPLAQASDLSATINWGDGTSPTAGTVVAGSSGGEFEIQGMHSYANPGTFTVTTTTTDDSGGANPESTTATSTATVDSNWGVLQAEVLTPGDNDPQRVFLLPIGEATVDLNTGGLRLSRQLDFDQSPGTAVGRNPALVYNSRTVNVKPVVEATLDDSCGTSAPANIMAQLTWNGTAQGWVTFSTSGWQSGVPFTFAIEVANPVQTSGEYNWSLDVHVDYTGGGYQDVMTSGTALVVANENSPYGAGWAIQGIDQLFTASNGVLWVTAAGDSRFFSGTPGPGVTFTSPAEDFGTLVENADSSFTYTAKDKVQTNFNSAGYQTSVAVPLPEMPATLAA